MILVKEEHTVEEEIFGLQWTEELLVLACIIYKVLLRAKACRLSRDHTTWMCSAQKESLDGAQFHCIAACDKIYGPWCPFPIV